LPIISVTRTAEVDELTMFSITVITSGTSLWAWLMALAMVAKLSSFVHAPTVDPGLQVSLLENLIRIEVDVLPIV
jgi:hypothetical protein